MFKKITVARCKRGTVVLGGYNFEIASTSVFNRLVRMLAEWSMKMKEEQILSQEIKEKKTTTTLLKLSKFIVSDLDKKEEVFYPILIAIEAGIGQPH